MRHVVDTTTNHEQAGGSKHKWDANRGDHIVAPFQVSVLAQTLEILLLSKKPLPWQKWSLCHLGEEEEEEEEECSTIPCDGLEWNGVFEGAGGIVEGDRQGRKRRMAYGPG